MTTTTAPAVKAALVQLLDVRPGLDGVEVHYGDPGKERQKRMIVMGAARTNEIEYSMMAGRKARREDYTLQVWCEVETDGGNAQSADEAVFALVAELENLLADDPKLAGLVPGLKWAVEDGWEDHPTAPIDTGWIARVTVSVKCEAYLP